MMRVKSNSRATKTSQIGLGIFVVLTLFHQTESGLSNKTTCHEGLGCFSLKSPWSSCRRPVPAPQEPKLIDTEIYCFTRESTENYKIALWPQIDLNGCPFKNSRPTVFICHGFRASGNKLWIQDMRTAYLEKVDVNWFTVNWSQGGDIMNYFQAASNTRIVGAEISRFLKFLVESHELNPSSLHMIGHSLGSHIMAYACKSLPGVARLTGLDPAQLCFEGTEKEVRIDKGDAKFVEVVHTSALPFIPFMGFGFIKPAGHVDYYINGGFSQPGCKQPSRKRKIRSVKDLEHITTEVLKRWVFCSHSRSYRYYINAIRGNCTIWGHSTPYSFAKQLLSFYVPKLVNNTTFEDKCNTKTMETCIPLGLDAPTYPARGVFAALTSKTPPYCDFLKP